MNIIEQFLRKVSYKFPKGYPDVNNNQDILLLEKILKEIGIEVTLNESIKNNTLKAINTLFKSKYGDKFSQMGGKTPSKERIGNAAKLSAEEFTAIIKDVFNTTPKIAGPGERPNPSGKYNMFIFNTPEGEVNMLLAGGPKADTTERQERGFVDGVNNSAEANVPKLLKGIGKYSIPNVSTIGKIEGNAPSGKEPYADVVINTLDGKKILTSAKGKEVPAVAGGGLAGSMLFDKKVQDFIVDFYEKSYQFYKKKFEDNPDYTYETNLAKNKDFPDVYTELPDALALEILKGTPEMGGPVQYYYIGNMDVDPPVITKNPKGGIIVDFSNSDGMLIPVEAYAQEKDLYPYIRKRGGGVFFTDDYQEVNGVKLRQIFKSSLSGKGSASRYGILDKPRSALAVKLQ